MVPNKYLKISKIFKKQNFKVFEIKQFNLNKIMKFNIKKFSDLGSDRIANALGINQKLNSNCIVVDFGTATTFDVIKKNIKVIDGNNIQVTITSAEIKIYII